MSELRHRWRESRLYRWLFGEQKTMAQYIAEVRRDLGPGASDIDVGLEALRREVADVFGLPLESIVVNLGDKDDCPDCIITEIRNPGETP